ncbi:MAG: cytochrome c oxidase assembly protein [Cellvibrionaceae bacterium]|nr:cytochrome c oxidase assembly protein [Cellvibrionaceae bacterium]
MAKHHKAIAQTSAKMAALVVAMFIFAVWVMPPIYDVFCDIAGLNGKTKGKYQAVEATADTTRKVQVRFVATNNNGMQWQFGPDQELVEVHPGQAFVTHFKAYNPTNNVMVAQAVPSMVPHNATDYFFKTECFCFNQQVLGPGESAELALKFVVDQEIPKRVNSIVLSYTLFDVTADSTEMVKQKLEEMAGELRNHSGAMQPELKLTTTANTITQ